MIIRLLRQLIIHSIIVSVAFSATLFASEYELIVYKEKTRSGLSFFNQQKSWDEQLTNHQVKGLKRIRFSNPRASFLGASSSLEVVSIESDSSVEQLITEISSFSDVSHVEPNYPLQLMNSYSDPESHKQFDLINYEALKLWALDPNREVIVAIIDTGLDMSHHDLSESVYTNPYEIENGIDDDNNGYVDDVNGYRWLSWLSNNHNGDITDDHGHGSHLAGIIAAANNDEGITGIHPEAKIMPLKVFDKSGYAQQLEAASAIRYAVDNGADIINCSWGYAYANTALKDALEYAEENGVIVLAAMGNAGGNYAYFPAGLSSVTSVGAVDEHANLSSYSNYGSKLDFTVPGEIYSTLPNSEYEEWRGTSQATAVLSGMMARLLAHDPDLNADSIKALFISASEHGADKHDTYGYGNISIPYLLAEYNSDEEDAPLLFSDESDEALINNVLNAPNPVTGSSTAIYFNANEAALSVDVQFYTMTGLLIDEASVVTVEGVNSLEFDLSDLSNGLYLYTLKVQGQSRVITGKCVILR